MSVAATGVGRALAVAISVTIAGLTVGDWVEVRGARHRGGGVGTVAIGIAGGIVTHALVVHHSRGVARRSVVGSLARALVVCQLSVVARISHMHGSHGSRGNTTTTTIIMTLAIVLEATQVEAVTVSVAVAVAVAVAVVGVAITEAPRSRGAVG